MIDSRKNVLLIDVWARERGHYIDDDAALCRCIKPIVNRLCLVSSPESIENASSVVTVESVPTPRRRKTRLSERLRLFKILLTVSCKGFNQIVFQSFEEITLILFMLIHKTKPVHIIVTHNLREDRLERHPVFGKWILRLAFRLASSVIIHSEYEKRKILIIDPTIDETKIHIKPFHMFAIAREQQPLKNKSNTILFMGPILPHKNLQSFLSLISADKDSQFKYVIAGIREALSRPTKVFLEKQSNVELLYGYLAADKYYHLVSNALFVFLSHDKNFCGTLSGVFCDAIASGTAVIAEQMAPHDEFFKNYGPMGYLIDHKNCDWKREFLDKDFLEDYHWFDINMLKCRSACTDAEIQKVFQSIL